MATDSYDVIIAGAGPSGSSLAIRLAMAGLYVLLIEQKKFPRDKLCGEFISPECLVHFEELGLSPAISASGGTPLLETVFYSRRGKGVCVPNEWFGSLDSLALGLSRAEMDQLLVRRAKDVGVDVREETSVRSLLIEAGRICGVHVKDSRGNMTDVTAFLTIDATGRARSLSRRLESKAEPRSAAKHIAFKTHLRGARVADGACEIYVYRAGYGGCNRVEDDLYNLCIIASAADTKRLQSDGGRVMREIVFTNKRARRAMENAVVVRPWLAVPIENFGRGELVPAEGLITVGDAAAFIDPFTGSGILLALESAKIAAAAIANSFNMGFDFELVARNYKINYSSTFDSRLRVCSMLRHAAFVPILAESIINILSLNERLRRSVARATRFSARAAS